MKKRPLRTRYIAFAAVSVDGKISFEHTVPPDWTSKEDWDFLQKSLTRMDAAIVGRYTYRIAADRLRKRNTYVFSRRIRSIQRRGTVTFLNPTRVDVRDMLSHRKTVAVLGGAGVYRYMLDHELMDELYLTIEPHLFGRGIDLFASGKRSVSLNLLSVRRLNRRGTLLLHYVINR